MERRGEVEWSKKKRRGGVKRRVGLELNGVEWSGVEWTEEEWSGVD